MLLLDGTSFWHCRVIIAVWACAFLECNVKKCGISSFVQMHAHQYKNNHLEEQTSNENGRHRVTLVNENRPTWADTFLVQLLVLGQTLSLQDVICSFLFQTTLKKREHKLSTIIKLVRFIEYVHPMTIPILAFCVSRKYQTAQKSLSPKKSRRIALSAVVFSELLNRVAHVHMAAPYTLSVTDEF